MTWRCHADESTMGKYEMIPIRDLIIELGLNVNFSNHVIKADDGPFKGSTTPLVYLDVYKFKDLNTGKTTPK